MLPIQRIQHGGCTSGSEVLASYKCWCLSFLHLSSENTTPESHSSNFFFEFGGDGSSQTTTLKYNIKNRLISYLTITFYLNFYLLLLKILK